MANRYYNVTLIEDTVGEPMPFKTLKDAARYLYDSDMSPEKPSEISIYTALVYAVKRDNRYKNYTIITERRHEMPMHIYTDTHTSYIPDEDITIVWQDMYKTDGKTTDCLQRNLVGWYYGEPCADATALYSNAPLTAYYVDCEN